MTELWAKVLAYVVPNLATILTTLGFFINNIHQFKKSYNMMKLQLDEKVDRIAKLENDIAVIKAKCESMENHFNKEK